jgi:hypothetical protein
MMIGLLGLVVIALFCNIGFYEFRVVKQLFKEPQYISTAYSKLLLLKRYK